jgi:predicted acyl esterase
MKMELAPGVPVYGIVVEKDVDVPMRDGARLKADVFRPDDAGTFPAILNLGPYQKDKLWVTPGNLEEKPNPLMNCFIRAGFTSPHTVGISLNDLQETRATSGFLVAKSGHPRYISG